MLDLNYLSKTCKSISDQREKKGAFPKNDNVLKHCAGEVLEAVEARQYYMFCSQLNDDGTNRYERAIKDYADELADIIYCVLVASAKDEIDIEKALRDCVDKNYKRAMGVGDKL